MDLSISFFVFILILHYPRVTHPSPIRKKTCTKATRKCTADFGGERTVTLAEAFNWHEVNDTNRRPKTIGFLG